MAHICFARPSCHAEVKFVLVFMGNDVSRSRSITSLAMSLKYWNCWPINACRSILGWCKTSREPSLRNTKRQTVHIVQLQAISLPGICCCRAHDCLASVCLAVSASLRCCLYYSVFKSVHSSSSLFWCLGRLSFAISISPRLLLNVDCHCVASLVIEL